MAERETQFYNEYTGETTWDQPVPSPEETRDKQGSNSGRIGHLLPGDQPRKNSPTVEEYSRNSGISTSKRGWFGFGRGAAKPRQQEETPIRLETRGTARNPTDMNDYKPTRDRDARRSPPREWPSDRGGKEMMPRQQGGPEGPGSRFGNGRIPAYDLRQNPPGSSTRAWGREDGGVAAQPWDDHAEHVKVQPSGTAMGGGIDRDRQMRDINESPAAALSAGHPGVVEGFNLEAVGPAISGDSERWMGDTTTIGAAVTDDVEPKAGNAGGLQGDTETSSGHVGISGEISYNETSITLERGRETDSMGTGTQEPKLQPHTKSTEGFGEGTTTLDATAMITDTEKAVATAGEQTSSLLAEEESPRDNEVSTPWEPEMTRTYAVNERQQDRSSAPEGEHHMAFFGNVGGYYPTEAWSGGKPGTAHGEDGSHWGDGFPPPERVKSPRQDAGGWDWSDPWGQEGAWDAPAWGVGTAGTQPHHKDEVVPTSNTRSQGAGNFPTHPTGEERDRDGWGVSIDQTRVGGQSSRQMTSNDVMAAATRRKELEELACALTETRKELEDARNVEEGLRSALCEQERAAIKATAAAVSAGEKAERAEALVRKREEDAKENSTAVGQWLVTLGIEQQELKGQLAAAVSNSTLLAQELGTLRQTAREAELRANTSEAKLKMALEDVEVLDEGLKQYMDGDGRRISPRPSRDIWKRVSEAYLRPLLPSKLKSPSPEELEAAKLERSLGRALENNSALAEAVKSKDEFVRDLNSRIDQFQLQAVRRRKGYRALKIGLADLTHEVQTKESMVIVLVVVMVQTASTLEGIYAVICAQREAFDCLASLSRDQENEVQSLALEVENGAARVAHLQEAVDRADSALSAIAASLGAGEACVQRWKDAFDQESSTASREDSLLELLRELHAAAACKFTNPLGLEPTTGAMTVAVPRMVTDQIDIDTKMPSRKRTFWGLFLDILCCRRRE